MRRTPFTNKPESSGKRLRQRSGTAAVELAICMPILVVLALATVEACAMMHVQQSLKISAFEGARVGTVPGANATNVTYQCQTLLDDHSVESYTITMDPPDPSTLAQGDYFEVTVSADFTANSLIGGWLYAGNNLSKSVSLRAE